jgi:hypothetical protein
MGTETDKKNAAKKPAAKKDRTALKARLASLKKAREAAKDAKDAAKLARVRRDYRRANHALRSTAAAKPKKTKEK